VWIPTNRKHGIRPYEFSIEWRIIWIVIDCGMAIGQQRNSWKGTHLKRELKGTMESRAVDLMPKGNIWQNVRQSSCHWKSTRVGAVPSLCEIGSMGRTRQRIARTIWKSLSSMAGHNDRHGISAKRCSIYFWNANVRGKMQGLKSPAFCGGRAI
jgi:hypothetical protein